MDAWNPDRYARFAAERAQPFRDLAALVEARPGMRVLDLGCGPGEMTAWLHERLAARETVGVDASANMLARAPRADGLRFAHADMTAFEDAQPFDLVFSNAALHWVPAHREVLARWTRLLAPDGQLAVQLPANDAHPSHEAAAEVAREFPELQGFVRRPLPLRPAEYAACLRELGYAAQHVRLQVYGHELAAPGEVIEWVRSSLLTDYEKRLAPEAYQRFLQRYREVVLARLGEARPYFYTYERILFWARLPRR